MQIYSNIVVYLNSKREEIFLLIINSITPFHANALCLTLVTRQATSTESLLFLSAGDRHNSMRRGTAEEKIKGLMFFTSTVLLLKQQNPWC